MTARRLPLRSGILPVLQTPFGAAGRVEFESLERLVDDAVRAGAVGLLAPAVASEVDYLSAEERRDIVRFVARAAGGRVPVIVGASSSSAAECAGYARFAEQVGAAAYLVAVPDVLYASPEDVLAYFREVTSGVALPLVIQDLQWNGPGLDPRTVRSLEEAIPALAGFKVETVPAGPKYTQVRQVAGEALYICGGWAVPQMIEALDRDVDGMVPEASMVRVYAQVHRLHASGARAASVRLFRRLLPVVAFTNQEIRLSIAFFKALLVRKGIFGSETMRWPGFAWDPYNRRIAEELIDLYLDLEREVAGG